MNYINQRPQGLGDIPRGLSAALPIAGPPGYAGEFSVPMPFYGKGGWLYLIGDTQIQIKSQTTNGVTRQVNKVIPTNSSTGQLIVQEYRAATRTAGSGSWSTGLVGTIAAGVGAAAASVLPGGNVLTAAYNVAQVQSGASGKAASSPGYTTAQPTQTIAPPIIQAPPTAPPIMPPPAPLEKQEDSDEFLTNYWWAVPISVGAVGLSLVFLYVVASSGKK
jgi:hypothetical protein